MSSATSCRVLVVEDHPFIAEMMGEMLTLLGHEPILVQTVAKARAVDAAQYDIVLCDFRLPDGDATTLLPELRRRGSAPVVLLTAYGAADLPSTLEGFDTILTKPVEMQQLDHVLKTLCPT